MHITRAAPIMHVCTHGVLLAIPAAPPAAAVPLHTAFFGSRLCYLVAGRRCICICLNRGGLGIHVHPSTPISLFSLQDLSPADYTYVLSPAEVAEIIAGTDAILARGVKDEEDIKKVWVPPGIRVRCGYHAMS